MKTETNEKMPTNICNKSFTGEKYSQMCRYIYNWKSAMFVFRSVHWTLSHRKSVAQYISKMIIKV